MAPETFARAGRKSAVHHQPQTAQARRAALHALLSCPTASIGTVARPPTSRRRSRISPCRSRARRRSSISATTARTPSGRPRGFCGPPPAT
ncbi:MAG TPA: ferredoxin [Candidatus Thermoplasmatota archaeon]|nr:ferredoxin [Candidatus Thermoplasmatota archaeon]